MKRLFLGLTLSLALVGCQTGSLGQRWVRTEVYFGLSKPDGAIITPMEWQTFIDEVVTPRFPAGLSVVDTAGQWGNSSGKVIHEASKMLFLLHPVSAETEGKIDDIRRQYLHRFHQEAVMKVTTKARVAF